MAKLKDTTITGGLDVSGEVTISSPVASNNPATKKYVDDIIFNLPTTLTISPSNFESQTAKTFLASPNDEDGTPTFREIVAADIPPLNQNTTGNAGTATKLATARNLGVSLGSTTAVTFDGSANQTSIPVSGILSVANGGTGNSSVDASPTASSSKMVTSGGVYTALAGKQATITGGATTITSSNLTASRALVSDSSGKVAVSAVTSEQLGFLSGASSNIQTQLGTTVKTSGNQTIAGTKTFSSTISGSINGNAATATKLGTATVGSAQLPIYLNSGTATAITTYNLSGTANQITVNGAGKILGAATTLSLPQNIHTGASPTFAGLNLGPETATTTWTITDTTDQLKFTNGGTVILPKVSTGTKTIAFTEDVQSGSYIPLLWDAGDDIDSSIRGLLSLSVQRNEVLGGMTSVIGDLIEAGSGGLPLGTPIVYAARIAMPELSGYEFNFSNYSGSDVITVDMAEEQYVYVELTINSYTDATRTYNGTTKIELRNKTTGAVVNAYAHASKALMYIGATNMAANTSTIKIRWNCYYKEI